MSRLLLACSLVLLSACSLTTDFDAYSGRGTADGDGGSNGEPTGGNPSGNANDGGSGPKAGELDLSVVVQGPGMVTSDGGFSCAQDTCGTKRAPDATTVFMATPEAEAAFDGWRGPCAEDALDGVMDKISSSFACTVKPEAGLEVTAIFAADRWVDFTVARSGTGEGRVTSADGRIVCEGAESKLCSARYVKGAIVNLTAEEVAGRGGFSGWGGACSGQGECSVTVFDAHFVDAVFNLDGYGALIVTKPGRGRGYVSSEPEGVTCGTQCSASYSLAATAPQTVTLTAMPEDGSTFLKWEEDCTPQSDPTKCLATVDGIERVKALFDFKLFELSVTWAGNGSGNVEAVPDDPAKMPLNCASGGACSSKFEYATKLTLTAKPAVGSMFVSWSGGGCGAEPTCKVDVTKDTMVVANFAVAEHTLTVATTGEGAVLCNGGPCEPRYVHGTSVSFTAPPAVGWELMAWDGECAGTPATDPCVKAITMDTTVKAVFVKQRYKLTVSIAGTGMGSVAGTLTCEQGKQPCTAEISKGDSIKLTATPGANSMFAGWGGACGGTGECIVDNVGAEVAVVANFSVKEAGKTTLVVAKTGKGTITSAPAGISCADGCAGANAAYTDGTSVELTATAAAGYGAPAFKGCDTTNAGKCQIAMNDADDTEEVTVTFAPTNVPVNVTIAGTGSGNVAATGITCATGNTGDCTENLPFGSKLVLTATASAGSTFTGWAGACAGIATPTCEITVAQTNAVTANFTARTFRIQTSTTGGFDGTSKIARNPAGSACSPASPDCGTYAFGTDVTLTATPGAGSSFVRWTGDAMTCGTTATCAIADLSADKVVGAEFAAKSYTVDVAVTGSGVARSREMPTPKLNCMAGGTGCSATFTHNTPVTLEAVAPSTMPPNTAGVRFTGWGGACTGTSQCSLGNLTSNRSVTATFVDQYAVTVNLTGFINDKTAVYVKDASMFKCQGNATPCRYVADANARVMLTATPPTSSQTAFVDWQGVTCSEGSQTGVNCTFVVTPGLNVSASFRNAAPPPTRTITVTVSGTGAGGLKPLVTASAAGVSTPFLSCIRDGKGCTGTVASGTTIDLVAAPPPWATFQSFSGAGSCVDARCSFTVTADMQIQASFAASGSLVFVTSSRVSGSGLGPSDPGGALCTSLAKAAGLDTGGAPFVPFFSATGFVDDPWTNRYNGTAQGITPFFRVDGVQVSRSGIRGLFVDGVSAADHEPLNVDQNGVRLADAELAWTGTFATGATDAAAECANWGIGDSSRQGRAGRPAARDTGWTDFQVYGCDTLAHLYCFQNTGP